MAAKKPTPKKPAPKAPAKPAPKAPAKPAAKAPAKPAPKAPAKPAAKAPAKPAPKVAPELTKKAFGKKAAPAPEPEVVDEAAAEEPEGAPSLTYEPSAVEVELLTVTKLEREEGEEEPAFLERVATAVSELEDKVYAKLSAESQAWFNAAVEAINNEKINDIPALTKTAEEETETPKAKTAAPKASAKPAKEESAPRDSGSSVARVIVCEQPDISLGDLKKQLKARGVKITDSQAHAVHNMTTRVLKVLKHLGKLK